MPNYRKLMKESYEAHQNFKSVWRDWRCGKLKDTKALKPHIEPKLVTEARNLCLEKNDLLYRSKIQPLERKFKENPNDSLDEVIEFLSVDIPAFRCGYAKEFFLKWLKQTKFAANEIQKLQSHLIKVCETESFRREFRRWCRLAVKIADDDFVDTLQKLSKRENNFVKVKSVWVLEMIEQNRIDLRNKLDESKR